MVTQDRPAIIDSLLSLPFPGERTEQRTRDGYHLSGPGYHVYALHATQDFWDDRSEEIVEAAEKEVDAILRALVAALTTRWGTPEAIDLVPYLWAEDPAPEPMNQLSGLSSEMLVWQRPDAGRWVGLAVGQQDAEFPIEVLAAVAETPMP